MARKIEAVTNVGDRTYQAFRDDSPFGGLGPLGFEILDRATGRVLLDLPGEGALAFFEFMLAVYDHEQSERRQ
ncbi:hypothetical protein ACFZ8E_05050 [Methylobacterium sp. HMF5984]|uniref:hypothetical protein n=1 Tax=Methylobacterium sp. HMF5984 TaxID=3367370 RepID=UPI0038522492